MTNVVRVSSTSLEYLRSRVRATAAGLPVVPTSYAVSFSFPASGSDPSTWYAGSWEVAGTDYYARCLVGTGGTATLTDGAYDVYVRVDATPELPVKKVGVLIVE